LVLKRRLKKNKENGIITTMVEVEKEGEEVKDIVFFAKTEGDGPRRELGLKREDRRRHMYLIGVAGSGKSRTMEKMICQDILSGHGVALIDFYGGLAKRVVDFIPSSRVNDTIYLNLADVKNPFSFNILKGVGGNYQHFLVVSNLVAALEKIKSELPSPRVIHVLRNIILALLEYQSPTLLGVKRMLLDEEYRRKVVERVSDEGVKAFWEKEYPRYDERLRTEVIIPIQEKIGAFFSIPLVRNIAGQVSSKVDIDEVINKEKILIVNLSKAIVGEEIAAFFGAMLVTKIQMIAIERLSVSENQRRDFYLYIDEFSDLITDSFKEMISQENKHYVNLILAHQYLGQLSETKRNLRIKDAIFNNIGTILAYKVNAEDALSLSKEVARRRFNKNKLANLKRYELFVKMAVNGAISDPIFARISESSLKPEENKDKIIKISRERYAEPQGLVEQKIGRWLGISKEKRKEGKKQGEIREIETNKYKSKCDKCGLEIYVPFIPDGIRPVYCRQCLKSFKDKQE